MTSCKAWSAICTNLTLDFDERWFCSIEHEEQNQLQLCSAAGNAHLESVLQTNLPEPYEASASAGDNLKEGVPEGLSDTVRGRGNR